MRRFLKILKWTSVVLVSLLLVFVFLVAPYLLAHLVTRAGTRPMDRRLTSSPADFNLEFEEVTFPSQDGVPLSGWYLGGADREISVACAHGLFRSRREVLERAAVLRQAGFNVLLFDLRRHGESEGERITLGYKERMDFHGAKSYLRQRTPGHRIVLFGVSMGAAAALLAAAEDDDIVAVIADSSFLSLEHTVAHHLKLFWGLPRFPLAYELIFFVEVLAEFSSEDLNLEEAVERIGPRQLLFIAGGNDRRMPENVQRRLFESAQSPGSRFVVVDGAGHGAAYRTDPETYRREVLDFLEEVLEK